MNYLLAGATMALAAFAPAADADHAALKDFLEPRGGEIVLMLKATAKDGQAYEIQGHDWAYGWLGSGCESRLTVGLARLRLDWSKVTSVEALGEKDILPNIAPVPIIDGKPQYPEPSKAGVEVRGSDGWLTMTEGRMPPHDSIAALRMERKTLIPAEVLNSMRRLAAACGLGAN